MTQETKTRLLQRLDHARHLTRTALANADPAGTDPTRAISPGWTVREMVAHFTAWDGVTADALRAHLAGEPYDTSASRDMDAYNARFIAARSERSLQQIVAEYEAARDDLMAVLEGTPSARLADEIDFPWGPRGSVAEMIAGIADHERYHLAAMGVALPPETPAQR